MQEVKILYLITELEMGGAQQALFRLLSGLDRERFQPVVACLYNGRGEVGRQITQLGIRVIDVRMARKWRWDALWRLNQLIREERPIMLHASMYHANILGRLFGRLNSIPIIIVSRRTQDFGGQWRRWINRFLANWSDRTIVVSEKVRETEIRQTNLPSEKVLTINNGIDIRNFQILHPALREDIRRDLGIPDNSVVIGSVGRLQKVKGYSKLLSAMQIVNKSYPEVYLVIVGEGDQRKALEQQALLQGLTKNVVFTGLRLDIPKVLMAFDMFALASETEGFPNAILEAMAAGLPVVATDVGGVPELILDKQTGFLVKSGDIRALAQALTSLINDPHLRHQLAKAGQRRIAQHFTIDQTIQKTVSLYDQLLILKGIG